MSACGAQHPELAITCGLMPGPNATREDGAEVHVHKAMDLEGQTHRWEDPADDTDTEETS